MKNQFTLENQLAMTSETRAFWRSTSIHGVKAFPRLNRHLDFMTGKLARRNTGGAFGKCKTRRAA